MRFLGLESRHIRPVTQDDVEPAPPPSLRKAAEASAGRRKIQAYMLSAERTMAEAQEVAAELAADIMRR